MSSCHCRVTDQEFDARRARRDLERFRKRGPDPPTQRMLAAIQDAAPEPGATLLDIGGGIGAVQHMLLDRGFSRAIQVDASVAYLAASAEEAARRGHADRAAYRHGDFREVAREISEHDVVTLDRVVCCDPDYAAMLGGAAARARRLVALTFPKYRWDVRAFVAIANGLRRLASRPFRAYVHDPAAMRAILERAGLRRRSAGGTLIWAAEVYERKHEERAEADAPTWREERKTGSR